MTRAVLSIGSNLGDRLARLRSVVDGFGDAVVGVSPVYETAPWGGPGLVPDQGPFLNAVLIVEHPDFDGRAWLKRGQELEQAAQRVRERRWGPRTLDVDVVSCRNGSGEIILHEPDLVLPHPLAHRRAFVLVPWLDVDPAAELTVDGVGCPVARLLADIAPADRAAVVRTDLVLRSER
jgi:2-amino-4-hydroxy-6-hydroxymethyldihydropteridine diphosphokinase